MKPKVVQGLREDERFAPRKDRERCVRRLGSAGCQSLSDPCFDHRYFKCPKCKAWVPWSKGCADDKPELCDDCWTGELL